MTNFQFSDSDGIELVKMARRVVTEFLKNNSKISDSEFDSKFDFSSGVFVTLNKEDDLRGCIGYPTPVKKLSGGLIVENDFSSGLLLPQVPTEYGWNEEEFLEHTCQKAGLNKDAWKEKSTTISKFQGVIFKEEKPNGNIIRESSNDLL
ncbi:AMMECR1 domain containing protein [Marine Group I thaumarchaeote SCGC AAA799-P11]|uniref:AMMECR1 domain containing protein n=1 Tax=Marine Group I thaumarchaeote SCGC AAA799-P11 TaxID=1502295 RepID=A0A087RWW7_9ARCH|nr:AMMECR1 domain containing protein [Marine Group I thaumarchaeote SCGC AAA799-P11]